MTLIGIFSMHKRKIKMKQSFSTLNEDYNKIEKAINYIDQNVTQQPSLEEISKHIHLSEFHFQRLFSRWVGVSPKKFLQFLTKEHAKKLLENSNNVLQTTYETGLSSPGRLHELFVNFEAVTPGEYKNWGESLDIEYGFHPTPFGEALLAVTKRGICKLEFTQNNNTANAIKSLKQDWPKANFIESTETTGEYIEGIFNTEKRKNMPPLYLFVKGTNFQIKIWEALLKIPYANIVSYSDIATYIKKPKAVRAVANAVGKNSIPFLIPCHRVIRKLGDWGGYRYGTARKKAIIAWELTDR